MQAERALAEVGEQTEWSPGETDADHVKDPLRSNEIDPGRSRRTEQEANTKTAGEGFLEYPEEINPDKPFKQEAQGQSSGQGDIYNPISKPGVENPEVDLNPEQEESGLERQDTTEVDPNRSGSTVTPSEKFVVETDLPDAYSAKSGQSFH